MKLDEVFRLFVVGVFLIGLLPTLGCFELWDWIKGQDVDKIIAVATSLAALAAGAAAVGTFLTLRRTQDTANRQLRAYVFIDDARILKRRLHGIGSEAQLCLAIRNFGLTPSYDTSVVYEFKNLSTKNSKSDSRSLGAIGPGAATIVCIEDLLFKMDLDDMQLEQHVVYVSGQITYNDTFGRRWFTNFNLVNGSKVFDETDRSGHPEIIGFRLETWGQSAAT